MTTRIHLIHIPPKTPPSCSFTSLGDAFSEVNRQLADGKQGTWILAEQVAILAVQTVEQDR